MRLLKNGLGNMLFKIMMIDDGGIYGIWYVDLLEVVDNYIYIYIYTLLLIIII